jgi:uncharacterized protein YeaO (DUF488 family)
MRRAHGELRVKRVYEPASEEDGARLLVDRLWPRGLTKEKARVDAWLKDVAPSDRLRKAVHAGELDFEAFERAYADELREEPASSAIATIRARLAEGPVTLLFAAKDEARNNAVALAAWLAKHAR